MGPLGGNPFAVLTFIVAPAILTNAASVMGLQTANRFARAIDRARSLSALLAQKPAGDDPESGLRLRQLESAELRVLLLVRALTAFYLSVGSFAAASFASLLGAICVVTDQQVLLWVALAVALGAGVTGVGGLLAGSGLVVWETRHATAILTAEAALARKARAAPPGAPPV